MRIRVIDEIANTTEPTVLINKIVKMHTGIGKYTCTVLSQTVWNIECNKRDTLIKQNKFSNLCYSNQMEASFEIITFASVLSEKI